MIKATTRTGRICSWLRCLMMFGAYKKASPHSIIIRKKYPGKPAVSKSIDKGMETNQSQIRRNFSRYNLSTQNMQ